MRHCRVESLTALLKTLSIMVLPLRVDYIQQLTPKSIPPGLDLASLADLPNDVLAEARRVSEKLVELEARKNEESKSNRVAIRRKALLRVKHPSNLRSIYLEIVLLTWSVPNSHRLQLTPAFATHGHQ